jgi:hypothetical protein
MDVLMNHLDLVVKLNDLWEKVNDLYSSGEAPSKLFRIEDEIRSVSNSLSKIPSTASDLQAIKTRTDEINTKILQLAQADPKWEAVLKKYFDELNAERAKLESDYPLCKGLYLMWDAGWTRITQEEAYDPLDTHISILRLIQTNIHHLRTPSDKAARKIFDEAVRFPDYRAARKAMREIAQGVHREKVEEALMNKQERPRVFLTQQTVREYSPVVFAIQFPDPKMNDCEALDAIQCQWDFGHQGLTETAWRVVHFFPKPASYTVKATFWSKGRQINYTDGPVEIKQTIRAEAFPSEKQDRTRAEVVQLAIVLLVALLGLLAGAREQLQKLDFLAATVALFLLGFGAEAIKTALAPAKDGSERKPSGG